MAKKSRRYCYRTPKYPEKAFLVSVWVTLEDKQRIVLPLYEVYLDLKTVKKDINKIQGFLEKREIYITDQAILTPIKLNRLFPLKSQYWSKPTVFYDIWNRLYDFIKVYSNYQWYKVLVTPSGKSDKEHFTPATPLSAKVEDKEIDEFMKCSDFPVDESAKFAAIYDLEKSYGFDWENGEIYQFTDEIPIDLN